MINLDEYKRFQHLERDPFVLKLHRIESMFAGALVKLPNEQNIPVKRWYKTMAMLPRDVYDYFLTPWGVLTYLGNGDYDKSPLCTQLDEELCKTFDQFLERNNLNAAQSR